jgi:UPF0755 protein
MPSRRKKKRNPVTRAISTAFTFIVIVGVLGVMAGFYSRSVFEAPGPLAEDRIFTVERGMRTPAIAQALKEAGVISDANVFIAAAYATQAYKRMKAGEYYFEKNVPMATVLSTIVLGKELTYKVSVPEGWTAAQVVERVAAHESLAGDLTRVPTEGTLLPDTYVFRRGMTRDGIIAEMEAAQDKLMAGLWDKRSPDLPFKTKEEALTLASIVERETAVPAERPRIAAVFINRLKAGMRLQSDPTIIYGITGGKTKFERPITRSDIEEKNPYNTYRIDGLPPTPIGNPGRESIAAVLQPLATKDLYFVADGTGGHVFAATLAEHSRNVAKWRAIERDLKTKAEEEAAAGAEEALSEAEVAAVAEPDAPVVAAGEVATSSAERKPGSVVTVSGRLVPIPMPSPRPK